jgi:co-chaperonin GroES (HSP10)
MRPIKKNVIVERVEPNLTTDSGIILKSPLDVDQAVVISVGPDVTEVSVGERVCLDWNKSKEIEKNVFLIPVEEIAFVYE